MSANRSRHLHSQKNILFIAVVGGKTSPADRNIVFHDVDDYMIFADATIECSFWESLLLWQLRGLFQVTDNWRIQVVCLPYSYRCR